jgi:crotonobetainyl-CoA:carnitine CoA-transferase CaiB-like acyl-CoA transferase
MWAFVPSCGGALCDMGAEVIKVEPPSGDPLRGLADRRHGQGGGGSIFPGKATTAARSRSRSTSREESGREVLMKLCEDADVFLTNLLPPARRKMGIDAETIRARFPNIIYASGCGTGPKGPENEKGGYDSITYWARSGISSTMTEDGAPYPGPGPRARRSAIPCRARCWRARSAPLSPSGAMTGEGSLVEVSLLGTAMWSMQR